MIDTMFKNLIPKEYHCFLTKGTPYEEIIEHVILEQQKDIDKYKKALQDIRDYKSEGTEYIVQAYMNVLQIAEDAL